MQGPRAAAAIATAIDDLCRRGADVIVLARGGGSFEDLLPFSDERVVRAVAACAVPVVSAVGHEQDTPLCDLAADVRASTPTAAARLVVPDIAELRERLERRARSLAPRRPPHGRAPRASACTTDARPAAARTAARARAASGRASTTRTARLGALSPAATLRARLRDRPPRRRRRALDRPGRAGRRSLDRVADGTFGAIVE